MKDGKLSRREILSGLAAAGGSGALVGSGTGSLFSDEETLTNNTLAASKSLAGVVDITVTIDANENGVEFDISLPEDSLEPDVNKTTSGGVNNNPAHLWIRTQTCPDPIEVAADLDVQFYVKGCKEATLIEGSLLDVLTSDSLREGFHLTCSEGECLQPDETRTVVIESSSSPSEEIAFDLKFYAQQCRYDSEAENPFDPSETIAEGECDPLGSDTPAISFVAFCSTSEDLTAGDITTLNVTETKDGGDPVAVYWESAEAVDTVVLKTGDGIESFAVDGATSGTARAGEGTEAGSDQSPSSPCPDGEGGPKAEWDKENEEFVFESEGGDQ